MHALSSTNKHTASPQRDRLASCPRTEASKRASIRYERVAYSKSLSAPAPTLGVTGRPPKSSNSTTPTSRTSALTLTSVASQSRSNLAARRRQLKPFRSTLAKGFLLKPSKNPLVSRESHIFPTYSHRLQHRHTPRSTVLTRRRQPKTFLKLTRELSSSYGHSRP